MNINTFYDTRTFTLTYVVWDEETLDAVVIDPVLDYDAASSKIWTESAKEVVDFVKDKGLNLHYILETHAHADHLSASNYIKKHFPEAQIAIGEKIVAVQKMFKTIFDLPPDFPIDGSQFDTLMVEGQHTKAGTIPIEVISTPGHTPACVTYKINDAIFTGDALFMPDMGTGRCDFPGGSAADMYSSVHEKLYSLPDETRVFVGHDYQPGGRELAYETTIGEQKQKNIKLSAVTSEQEFVTSREARDRQLNAPKLLFQSVQVNVDAGRLPTAHDNAIRYLKIPINVFRPEEEGEMELQGV